MFEQIRLSVTKTKYRLRRGVKPTKKRAAHRTKKREESPLFIVDFSRWQGANGMA